MLSVMLARLDRCIADLMFARARRRWPLLRLVPRTLVRPVLLPAAMLARQDAVRVVVLAAVLAGALLVVITVF